jgi:adenine phosphoribosyltransferase
MAWKTTNREISLSRNSNAVSPHFVWRPAVPFRPLGMGKCPRFLRPLPQPIFRAGIYLDLGPHMSDIISIDLRNYIRDIPDFPKPGVLYRDITPLLASPQAFAESIRILADHFRDARIDVICAAESRGFIFATPLALELGIGFVPIRKPGKLPGDKHSHDYELEYGTDTLEVHTDGIGPNQRALVVDDLLATGGTVDACCQLVEKAGAEVACCAFLIELTSMGGRQRIEPRDVYSIVQY